MNQQNYYEVLQLSPNAQQLVIAKIYRLLAAYYHPDNKQTGDEEKFKLIIKAYDVLSDPAKRSRYDLEVLGKDPGTPPKTNVDFTVAPEGGKSPAVDPQVSSPNNLSERDLRNLLLLSLYDIRRNNPSNPEVSLLVLAELLGCQIGNLEFSNWYLKEKGLIKINESADFSITVAGVDYVEKELLRATNGQKALSLPEGSRL